MQINCNQTELCMEKIPKSKYRHIKVDCDIHTILDSSNRCKKPTKIGKKTYFKNSEKTLKKKGENPTCSNEIDIREKSV